MQAGYRKPPCRAYTGCVLNDQQAPVRLRRCRLADAAGFWMGVALGIPHPAVKVDPSGAEYEVCVDPVPLLTTSKVHKDLRDTEQL